MKLYISLRYSNVRGSYKDIMVDMIINDNEVKFQKSPLDDTEFINLTNEQFKKAVEIAKSMLIESHMTYKSFSSYEVIKYEQ